MNDWKIDTDPYYSELHKTFGKQYIFDAGFFHDCYEKPLDLHETLKILCTPIKHIKTPKTKKHCILLTSGAMDPIHLGHIDMMLSAKIRLEQDGYEVLGGYICPAHDSYVSSKNDDAYPIHIRVRLISEFIEAYKQTNWLSVDPWSGIFTKGDINFTLMLERLKLYIAKYLNLETEIIYVCGEDRATFSETFRLKGKCVVVGRGENTSNFNETDYALFASCDNNRTSSKISKIQSLKKRDVIIRDDKTFSVAQFNNVFSKYFNSITFKDFDEQKNRFFQLDQEKIISIDSMLKSKYYVTISRLYDFFGCTQHGYLVKSMNLPVNVDKAYTLVDDDCVSGRTMDTVKVLLSHHKICVNDTFIFTEEKNNIEILDMRDFVLFGENSGLVAGDDLRLPYIYPFVDPFTRCSVIDPLNFSLDIWLINKAFISNIGINKIPQFNLFSMLGFDSQITTHEICDYYIRLLRELKA
jgi:hypothetical protein